MRQIKFRGKCQRGYDYSDGDGWIYGSLLQKDKVYAIVKTEDIDLSPNTDDGYSFVEDFGCIPVLPDTVSQFTGLTDRNGKEVYHKDRVNHENYGEGVIEWDDKFATFFIDFGSEDFELQMVILSECELLNEKQ